MASLASGIAQYNEELGIKLVDSLIEKIFVFHFSSTFNFVSMVLTLMEMLLSVAWQIKS